MPVKVVPAAKLLLAVVWVVPSKMSPLGEAGAPGVEGPPVPLGLDQLLAVFQLLSEPAPFQVGVTSIRLASSTNIEPPW